jgi:carboxypeptidase T
LFLLCLVVVSSIAFVFVQKGYTQSYTYHASSDAVIADLQSLVDKNPAIAQMVPLTPKTSEGRTIWAIKITKDPKSAKKKNRILFESAHHAREWISTEVSYLLAKNLVESYASDAKIKSYIDNEEIWIVPLTNPDGYEYTKKSSSTRLWRKDRHDNGGTCSKVSSGWGIDPNRNYAVHWGEGKGNPAGSPRCTDETYRGPSADSAPETQAMSNLLEQYQFTATMHYHSFAQLILYPYGYTNKASPDSQLFSTMANTMSSLIKAVHGVTYTPEQSSKLYITSGSADDYVYDTYKIPSFTIELRPTQSNSTTGFLLPASQIQPTWEENKPAALYFLDLFNLSIQEPTQDQPLAAKSGETATITVNGMWRDKTAADFVVKIGGTKALIKTVTRLPEVNGSTVQNAYTLEVQIPQKAAGKYDLQVLAGDMRAKAIQAISFGQGAGTATPSVQPSPTKMPKPTALPSPKVTFVPTNPPPPATPTMFVCLGCSPTATPTPVVSVPTQAPFPSVKPPSPQGNQSLLALLISLLQLLLQFFSGGNGEH